MLYIISDIHAQYNLFMRLLDYIKFSDSDSLICCGDMVDKGKDSVRLLKFFRGLKNARCIIGNHEYGFLKYYWALMRGSPQNFGEALKKLQEYFYGDGALLDWETVDWLEGLPFYIEEKDFICVHAGIPLDKSGRAIPPVKASREQLVYDREFKSPDVVVNNSKCIFFGHTPTSYILPDKSSRIIAYPRADAPQNSRNVCDFYKIHLDTGCWISGVLGCFCVDECISHYVKSPLKN